MGKKSLEIWEKMLIKNLNPIDQLYEVMINYATEDGKGFNPDMYREFVDSAEKLHATIVTLYVVNIIAEAQDKPEILERVPGYIQACKDDFIRSVDGHIRVNLEANDLVMPLSHNEEVSDAIKKELDI